MPSERRAILWTPIFIAFGIGGYFSLTFEPELRWAIVVAAVGIIGLVAGLYMERRWIRLCLIGMACISLGFAGAMLRTHMAGTPVLDFSLKETVLTGHVLDVETRGRGWRTLLQIDEIDGLAKTKTPRNARLTWPASLQAPVIGTRVDISARLWPPPRPATPGGFDFGRQMFFQGVGAFGQVTSFNSVEKGDGSWRSWLQGFRRRAATNIATRIGGQEGAVAAALVTGDRTRLSKKTKSNLRAAGLAHLLAISGLHMGLAVGVVFFGARAILALFPVLVLRYPIKKWAAIFALISGAGYLALSGASVSTIRAFIMAAIALGAILVDRQAISLRTVAIAATIILITQPEVLVQAGFQMSFAAVVALVTIYEMWGRRVADAYRSKRGVLDNAFSTLFGIGLTSLIAGLATAPFAAAHFNRITAYGLLGNLAAMPVMALLIMPAAVIACFLTPFGIAQPAWLAMGMGIGFVLDIAQWIAQLPGADLMIPSPREWVLPILALGGVMIAIQRQTAMRIIGAGVILLGLSGFIIPDQPNLLAGRWGQTIAIRGEDGLLHLVGRKPKSYEAKQWLRRDGQKMDADTAVWDTCMTEMGCTLPGGAGILQIAEEGDDIGEMCDRAQIIISSFRTSLACPKALLLDPGDFSRQGNVRIDPHTLDLVSVVDMRGKRPWASSQYWK